MSLEPLTSFRFLVSLDPADAYLPPAQAALVALTAAGQFTSVTGLGGDLELLAHPEGGRNDFVHQLPVRHSYPRIVLSRGLARDPSLFLWYEAGLYQSLGARRNGAIVLLSTAGVPAFGWVFYGGLAAAWKGPELRASDSAVAVETIEIAHEGLIQVPLSLPGMP